MDDMQFARMVSPMLGGFYQEAKNVQRIAPSASLISLRALASAFCSALDRDKSPNLSLNDRIRSLANTGIVGSPVIRKLRTLQDGGNKAAHPEEYGHLSLDYSSMAESAMEAARALLEHLYRLHRGEAAPSYTIAEVTQIDLQQMCYRAMFEDDPAAIHQAGVIFKAKADQSISEALYVSEEQYSSATRADLEQAAFWFKRGSQKDHPDCKYQYALYCFNSTILGSSTMDEARRYVWQAADAGHTEAQVLLAGCLLGETNGFDCKPELAIEYYSKAAEQEHPEALAQLGAIYSLGLGCAPNPKLAVQYTIRSAEAGFPKGQYNLYCLYFSGSGVEKDFDSAMHWLKLARDQDFPDAIYSTGILAEQGQIEGQGAQEALELFLRSACFEEFSARSLIAFCNITVSLGFNFEKWLDAAIKLQQAYETISEEGDPHSLKEVCLGLSAMVVKQVRSYISRNGPSPELGLGDLFVCSFFDRYGVPVTDADARHEEISSLINLIPHASPAEQMRLMTCLLLEAQIPPPKNVSDWGSPQKPTSNRFASVDKKQPRNEPCSCGSGNKFKKCCGR